LKNDKIPAGKTAGIDLFELFPTPYKFIGIYCFLCFNYKIIFKFRVPQKFYATNKLK
jgi:hypothetical protein